MGWDAVLRATLALLRWKFLQFTRRSQNSWQNSRQSFHTQCMPGRWTRSERATYTSPASSVIFPSTCSLGIFAPVFINQSFFFWLSLIIFVVSQSVSHSLITIILPTLILSLCSICVSQSFIHSSLLYYLL